MMIPDTGSQTLMSVIRRKIRPASIVYSDSWHAYRTLDVSEFQHERINHARCFSEGHNHINGREDFCGIRRNGVCDDTLDDYGHHSRYRPRRGLWRA
ncbi:transposase [Komagataeibacter diospyri]